jgi:hypothetical protein
MLDLKNKIIGQIDFDNRRYGEAPSHSYTWADLESFCDDINFVCKAISVREGLNIVKKDGSLRFVSAVQVVKRLSKFIDDDEKIRHVFKSNSMYRKAYEYYAKKVSQVRVGDEEFLLKLLESGFHLYSVSDQNLNDLQFVKNALRVLKKSKIKVGFASFSPQRFVELTYKFYERSYFTSDEEFCELFYDVIDRYEQIKSGIIASSLKDKNKGLYIFTAVRELSCLGTAKTAPAFMFDDDALAMLINARHGYFYEYLEIDDEFNLKNDERGVLLKLLTTYPDNFLFEVFPEKYKADQEFVDFVMNRALWLGYAFPYEMLRQNDNYKKVADLYSTVVVDISVHIKIFLKKLKTKEEITYVKGVLGRA